MIFPLIEKLYIKYRIFLFFLLYIILIQIKYFDEYEIIRKYIFYLLFFAIGDSMKKVSEIKYIVVNSYGKYFLLISFLFVWFYLNINESNSIFKDFVVAFLGILISIFTLWSFPKIFSYFEKYGRYSLALYILNGYCLVISRSIVCILLKCQSPIIIILFNYVFDFHISFIIIKYLLFRIKIVRLMFGEKK